MYFKEVWWRVVVIMYHATACVFHGLTFSYPESIVASIDCHRHWTHIGHSRLEVTLTATSNFNAARHLGTTVTGGVTAR